MTDTSLTLLDLVRRDKDGPSWDRLLRLYEPIVRAWLSSNGLQTADIDDCCQDVLRRLYQSLMAFQHTGMPGSFRSWLRAITLNTVRDFWRHKQRQIPADHTGPPLATLEAIADDHDELMRRWDEEYNRVVVHSALRTIRPHFDPVTWDSFCRLTFDGQTPHEVATALSMSVNSVYLARSRILRRLRSEIRGLLGD